MTIEGKRITINLSEYEALHKTIKDKEGYIHAAIIDKKIRVKMVPYVLFKNSEERHYSQDDPYYLVNLLTDVEIEKITETRVKEEIKELYEFLSYAKRSHDRGVSAIDMTKRQLSRDSTSIAKWRKDTQAASWATRLKWLFTGVK